MGTPPDLKDLETKLGEVQEAKKKAVEEQRFEEAGRLRDQEKTLLEEKSNKEAEVKASGVDLFDEVDEEAVAEVLSIWTGIPVYKLTEEETAKLLNMEDELHKRIIGQENAIKAVSQSIRRTRAGLKDPKRPSGSFIFLGPTGVGKTELAKTLTEFLFGDDSALISLDMSEYMEKHTVSRLVGAPPGYVGYEEGGQLTEAVRRKPFSVVLFDEIEKAHPDVFNTLLQILEEGRLTDSQGRTVDFRNTVLIMTSNLGTADLRKANVGFTKNDEAVSYERMKDKVMDALKTHFRPEFLNRIDDVIVFHELAQSEVMQMVDLMTKRLMGQLESQGLGIELTQSAKELLAKSRATTRSSVLVRCVVPSSAWSKIRCRRRSCTRSSAPARSSSSTPKTIPIVPVKSASSSARSRASCPRRRSNWPALATAVRSAAPTDDARTRFRGPRNRRLRAVPRQPAAPPRAVPVLPRLSVGVRLLARSEQSPSPTGRASRRSSTQAIDR